MATHELIDAQFDRAVEIVQSLPKTGPIQTDYEEKLQMYSLYKQATVGNVKSPRPGIWDMLGRAKWDAWAKHKDLDSYEAKWSYVEALLKVLRRYSDKTVAQNLVQELESYGGDPSNLVMSRTSVQSPGSESSGSTTSHDAPLQPLQLQQLPRELRTLHSTSIPPRRPHSSHSTHRYQTPITGSLLSQSSGPALGSGNGVPVTQPLPTFETPSAFPAPPPSSTPASRLVLEHTIENVQAHLAALTERLETLEARSMHHSSSSRSGRLPGRGGSPRPNWDLDDLGMWSYVLNPISRAISFLHKLARFFASDPSRSPTGVIVRRLCLDLSFLVCVVAIIGAVWRKSGVRRREVKAALLVLWRAIVGNKGPRTLHDRGV
ncbi:hypothetical protein AN958_07980 [Leucoagaricus sp. SymC.cos]|nr:hypothetical protein AN958_07980 [Leucoagaricus sp. SymC.cos]